MKKIRADININSDEFVVADHIFCRRDDDSWKVFFPKPNGGVGRLKLFDDGWFGCGRETTNCFYRIASKEEAIIKILNSDWDYTTED
jgi:hypothetical protein